MDHIELLTRLASEQNIKAYLEIGVANGANFRAIECEVKVGVDPHPKSGSGVTHPTTSDKFFAKNRRKYDLIFIDGEHTEEQCARDLQNALKYLKKGGTIVVHDVYPRNYEMQRVPRLTRQWTGDVWKAWVRFIDEHGTCLTLSDDYGMGVYNAGLPDLSSGDVPEKLTWDWFTKHRGTHLNLVAEEELFEMLEHAEV